MTFKPGNICHVEIPTPDIAKMKEFYGKVFGWDFTPLHDGYEFFDSGNLAGAFVQHMQPLEKGVVITIYVEDVATKLNDARAAGGRILQEAENVPAGGRGKFGYFADPCGNKVGVWME